MKRVLFFIVPILSTLSIVAQDTIYSMPDKYFRNYWRDSITEHSVNGYSGALSHYYACRYVIGYTSQEPLAIYGLAVALICNEYYYDSWRTNPSYYNYVADTTFNQTYEYVGLYNYNSEDSSISVVEEKKIHIGTTPVTHWWDVGVSWNNPYLGNFMPIYEVYFDQKYIVQDTFYIGKTGHTYTFADNQHGLTHLITCAQVYSDDPDAEFIFLQSFATQCMSWAKCTVSIPNLTPTLVFFPITEPNPNPQAPDDSTSTLLHTVGCQRVLTVSPNPADGVATVESDLPLAEVMAFDALGRCALRSKSTHIDTRRLPNGVYTIRAVPADGSPTLTTRLSVIH